jgi:hypothetical protein
MRRLKEGFYTIMKLADAVKAGKAVQIKAEMIEFSQAGKLEKPSTEAILKLDEAIQ